MNLADDRVTKLCNLIRDSFRVRENQDPIYVDISGRLERVAAKQHQIIFGRRGSGKSCLLVHYHKMRKSSTDDMFSIYVQCDEIKTLPYPDILIRLLLTIMERMPRRRRWITPWKSTSPLGPTIRDLRQLLDSPQSADIQTTEASSQSASANAILGNGTTGLTGTASATASRGRSAAFREDKLDYIDRHLQDFKEDMRLALAGSSVAVLVDDFYLLNRSDQPKVIDYLHRFARDINLYLKVGTVRHRTSLSTNSGQFIGVELSQDIEAIDLDQTLENFEATQDYLSSMLDSMATKVGLPEFSKTLISPDGLSALTLCSGGVPRDYLTIVVEAIEVARQADRLKWLTPTRIYKGAGRLSYRTKLTQLRSDSGNESSSIERVFVDVNTFCLKEKRKTAFLVSQDDVSAFPDEHELIQQLMDFKLVHVIEPDTSAASGRPGRYEAYTLDFALFMEPRLRNIEHVEFWKTDSQRRRVGAREAPTYSLERARGLVGRAAGAPTETVLDSITQEIGTEDHPVDAD